MRVGVPGTGSIAALEAAGAENLTGKILIDVSNALDFSTGMPPSLFVANTDSLGERIQRAFPQARVVKTLNTVNAYVIGGPHAGGERRPHRVRQRRRPGGQDEVTRILKEWFGWKDIMDLGDISSARGPEMYLALWLRLWGTLQNPMATIKVVS
jgi:predicted dinucleotide-binding enzyme